MNTPLKLNLDHDSFSINQLENIVVLKLKETFLLRISDLKTKAMVLDYLNLISNSDSIKTMVIFGSPQEREAKDYFEFYRQMLRWISDQGSMHRTCNAIDQLVLALRKMKQIIIHADRRKVISTFLNWSFSCDYRIVTHNAVFQNSHLEMGLIPKGGSIFFLSKLLGMAKTFDILLSDEKLTAPKALQLQMVNTIASLDQLEEVALKVAHRFSQYPLSSLTGMKHLMNHTMEDLEDFLSLENDELFRMVNQPDFHHRLAVYYPEMV